MYKNLAATPVAACCCFSAPMGAVSDIPSRAAFAHVAGALTVSDVLVPTDEACAGGAGKRLH